MPRQESLWFHHKTYKSHQLSKHQTCFILPSSLDLTSYHSSLFVLPDISREAFLWKDGKQESFNTSFWLHPLPVSMMARDFCTSDHPCLHQNLLHAPTLPHINPLLILLVQDCNTRQTSTACILTTPNSDRAINFYFCVSLPSKIRCNRTSSLLKQPILQTSLHR